MQTVSRHSAARGRHRPQPHGLWRRIKSWLGESYREADEAYVYTHQAWRPDKTMRTRK